MKKGLSGILAILIAILTGAVDAHAQWVQVSNMDFLCIAVQHSTIFAGNFGVYRSTDFGIDWVRSDSGIENPGLAGLYTLGLATDGSNIYAATLGGGIFQTTDGGVNWFARNNGLGDSLIETIYLYDGVLFAGTDDSGVRRSSDGGANWIFSGNGIGLMHPAMVFVSNDSGLFAGTFGGGVFRSTNAGATWQAANAGIDSLIIYAMATGDSALWAGTDYGVFRSTNNGKSWQLCANGFIDSAIRAFAVIGTNIFAGTETQGVYRSTNDGANWSPMNAGLVNTYVDLLDTIDTSFYVSTNDGFYRTPLDQFESKASVRTSPLTNIALTALPNPFTERATIHFSSPESGSAQVSIVNTLGIKVTQIFSGDLSVGEHSFSWDARGFVPGMYECVVKMAGRVTSAPILLE